MGRNLNVGIRQSETPVKAASRRYSLMKNGAKDETQTDTQAQAVSF